MLQGVADENEERERPEKGNDSLRALILGLNAWAVVIALPLAFAPERVEESILWSLIPLALLLSGILQSRSASNQGEGLLLLAFPVALGATAAWRSGPSGGEMNAALGSTIAALSLLLYWAAALRAVNLPVLSVPARVRTLGPPTSPPPRTRHRRLASRLLWVSGLSSIALATLSPLLGSESTWASAWGEAADEARVLVTVVAGALACAVLVAFIGPATRARRGPAPDRARSDRRAMLFTTLALGAAAGWLLLERLG